MGTDNIQNTIISRAVMDAVMDPIFVLRADDHIIDCNAAACSLLEMDLTDIRNQQARQLFAQWPDGIIAALDFPEAETEIELRQRRQRSYRITVVSGHKDHEREDGWKILMFNDITGERQLTRELSDMNENLEQIVLARTESLQAEIERRREAEAGLQEVNREMATTQRELLLTLSSVVESRSRETANHVARVAELARMLGNLHGLPPEDTDILAAAAPMHDVGKIAVPDAILCKPGPLTSEERALMQKHSTTGYEILHRSERPLLRAAAVIAHEHHERWDGFGYPRGISGEKIALSGRIVAICDVFDALVNPRVYKAAWPIRQVIEQFHKDSGTAFDPDLTRLLLSNIDQAVAINDLWQ
ncbi:MAG: HD domain-containing protein [Spirochaetes bacterium]|nr:HD domain-containing protein [Spirochaetota bacterium]MBU0956724.1 HD domain-containing protein [Spirochaetota bacterium]